ncbi:Ig-like domain-containing protein, partial [Porphyromonas sp. CAG:1061]|uniref:Ig-like domain-containing protein n=1 Tax=Porphyromonas sp. CAG:1061 TaxID=1262916 RepID=UPI002590BAF1
TSVRQSDNDPKSSYYGYALHRRHDGEGFVDNDNSTIDFEKQPASLLTEKPEPLLFPNITLKTKSITLSLGQEPYQLKWEVRPRRSKNRKAQWSSLDETIATVDDKGRVTPVAVGETEIIATLPNGANDHCTVTVKEN